MNTAIVYPRHFERWMITLTIMMVAVIEVLDMTIVNVALAPMMGALGATSDQISWVLTSYIVSSAIFMVLTGFMEKRFGQRKLLMLCILGFLASSVLCGIATTLTEIVLFRTLQGVFGAGLVPLSQTILRKTYPPRQQGQAMAIWGIGIMVAPVLGPTLGGYITEHLDWRWIFYINVPVCILSFLMALRFIKSDEVIKGSIDWAGMLLMAVAIGSLQIFLDRGNSNGWFQSNSIIALALISTITLSAFIIRGIYKPDNIINLRIFLNRNFSLSTLMMTLFATGVIGIISIQPLLLENLLGYPTQTAGLIMAPRGIAAALGMVFVGIASNRFDARKFMLIGLLLAIYGTYIQSGFNLQTDPWHWAYSGAVQGLGMGMFFVPLGTLSLSTLQAHQIAEGAGLLSFSRNLGISIGISLLSTLISRETQINWNQLGGHINRFNHNLFLWLQHQGWTLQDPVALGELERQLSAQAGMIAFMDAFWIVAIALVFLIPLIFFVKPVRYSKDTPVLH